MKGIAWNCALISMLRWKGIDYLNVTWKNSFFFFLAPTVSQGSISCTDNTERIKYSAVSILCLSAEAAWQPRHARSWPDLKSWLSPVSYYMLHFLAAFPNGFHLSVLLVLLVDHWKYLRSVWETQAQMNHGLVFLQRFSPAVSPAQQGVGEASPSWPRLKQEAEWAVCGDAW